MVRGFGIFYMFPSYGKHQIGWVPKEKIKDIELMMEEYKHLDAVIESVCIKDLTPTFRKVKILVSIFAI